MDGLSSGRWDGMKGKNNRDFAKTRLDAPRNKLNNHMFGVSSSDFSLLSL